MSALVLMEARAQAQHEAWAAWLADVPMSWVTA